MWVTMLRRISTAISIFTLFCATGWGDAANLWTGAGGQHGVTLRWTGGSQTAEKINLAGAKNEHLFLQIFLAGGSVPLKASAEGLPNGLDCQFFRVVAAPATQAGNFPPDALLPLEESIPGAVADPLPLWVSVKIAPDCLPGLHRLDLVITDRRGSLRLPVDLKVYRFTLPEDLPIAIFGGLWPQPELWRQYAKGQPLAEASILKKYYQSLREHKFNALGGSYPLPLDQIDPGQRIEDFSTYHDLLRYALHDLKFKYFQIPKLNGWKSVNSPEGSFPQAARRFYPLYTEYLRRQGWESRALNYLVDEPRPLDYEAAIRSFALAQSLSPGIRTLSAGKRPPPGSAGVIDIWAYQAGSYREDDREQARRQGQEAWLYANRLQGIDHSLAHQRLIGWLLYRYQFSGYLLWGVNYWPQDPWTTPPGPQDFFRRGTFYYPHPRTGLPVPTTRLEALRRGFQDYQYLLLLDQACRRGLAPREQQQLVSARVHRFTENLPRNPFPVSMAELEALRLHIGEILDGMRGDEEAHGKIKTGIPMNHSHREETAR
jgi:hypothetical protein